MSGALIKVSTTTVSSSTGYVDIVGFTTDFDVYMMTINKLRVTTDERDIRVRFLESGVPNSSANYDYAMKYLGTAGNGQAGNENQTEIDMSLNIGNDTGEMLNSIQYIYNVNNSGIYTMISFENTIMSHLAELRGFVGCGLLTVNSQVNGIRYSSGGNIDSAVFTLYGLKKD